MNNNPVNYTDPTGHRACDEMRLCNGPVDEFQLTLGQSYEGDWDVEQQQANSAKVETVVNTTLNLGLGLVSPPLALLYQEINGEKVNGIDIAFALLPGAGKLADELDVGNGLIRVIREDWVGTSQGFKLRAGEDGLSVFEGVTSGDVLAELPGVNVPNTTVIIPKNGLPPGTQVIPTAANGLSQLLSDAHRILIPPGSWSADKFAKALKALVGW
jgi:hypothetical protein